MSSPIEGSVQRTSEVETPEHEEMETMHTNEENEEELVKIHVMLHRYDTTNRTWKVKGTGDIVLLRHNHNNTVRVIMTEDKTFKVCANHFITADMKMSVQYEYDKAFNWSVFAGYVDIKLKPEILAIKFENPQNAELWKAKLTEAQKIVRIKCSLHTQGQSSNDVSSIGRIEQIIEKIAIKRFKGDCINDILDMKE